MPVIVPGVVLAQQVAAVVVAVRRAHDGVDVVARRRVVVVGDAGLVVELNEDHRAQDSVIERACVVEWADPREMRVVKVALRLSPADLRMSRPQLPGVNDKQPLQPLPSGGRSPYRKPAGSI